MKLSLNVGGLDRIARLILGVVLIVLAYMGFISGTGAVIAYVVAAIALVTGLVKFCPVNTLIGVNTNKVNSKKSTD